MGIRVAIDHETLYRYDRLVQLTPQVFRLRPAVHSRTPILHYALQIEPRQHFLNWQQDAFGNWLARVVFPQPAQELRLRVSVVAELTVTNPFDFFVEDSAAAYPFAYGESLSKELAPYLEVREAGPALLQLVRDNDRASRNTVDFLVELNRRVRQRVQYSIRMEPGVQSCELTLNRQIGSCRDSAWLLVQLLRHLGLAARFVSGYLVQLTADVQSLDGPSGPEADFTDLHAWAEVYVPGAGWLGLDPTSGLFAGEGHIPLACAPDPAGAAPVTGAYLGEPSAVAFQFHNRVQRLHEDPRVTKPYSDEQWDAIHALGLAVDRRLEEGDVRLTMGGEPTFVSIDDQDSPQWNTEALGQRKQELALELLDRLKNRFAPGAARHFGQGKWYPGEPLPRWAYGCFWRKDGQPIWRDDRWVAVDNRSNDAANVEQAGRFARTLAIQLGLSADTLSPGYEDVYYYLWRDGQLPDNVDPLDSKLDDPLERERLRRLFTRELEQVVGYALPLGWDYAREAWVTAPWRLRRQRLYLLPGDSPMGYRLPLAALPWTETRSGPEPQAPDAFETRAGLGDTVGEVARHYDHWVPAEPANQGVQEQAAMDQEHSPGAPIRTALCVEPRDGCLRIFLPPLTHLEHYVQLVAAIENSARECAIPVRLEGYEPPQDPRLERLLVTPDPGVIEVNIHPAADWTALVEHTHVLYEEARLTRLGTEKFLMDGRHIGTGGGNHVTIGGPTPADSPLLRRPDLLRSLITYWQHHPGLSYLFSGLFVGPTCQAPRVDEGRDAALYELEIAFSRVPEGESPAPWLVDRLLRHLLVDVTGNTHRAEFCIDKLYAPDSATGRLGILELRAFEMPPHPRMALVQNLLLRALIARFWRTPYRKSLVRWGTALHDRWLLPHYVRADLDDVISELRADGLPFESSWLEPFHAFRFPQYGTLAVRDLVLELRQAIEPWPVLGEEVTGQGTSRFVDSSVERLQVKLQGLTDSRHIVLCNGCRVPIRSTGTQGEYVAGVRFRAWQPPSALHPTIGIHAPLRFELVDVWNDRVIGACTYHVAHPGGRNDEVAPVNAFAAEARRIARFWNFGYGAAGEPVSWSEPGPEAWNPEYPHTLDLRRQ